MTAYAIAPAASPVSVRVAHSAPAARRSTIPAPARPRMHVHAIQTPEARRRRTRVARGVLVVVALAVLVFFAPRAFAGDEAGTDVVLDTYTVAQGETLWSIASALTAPGEDVRATMREVQTLNAMNGAGLEAGEQIAIPALGK